MQISKVSWKLTHQVLAPIGIGFVFEDPIAFIATRAQQMTHVLNPRVVLKGESREFSSAWATFSKLLPSDESAILWSLSIEDCPEEIQKADLQSWASLWSCISRTHELIGNPELVVDVSPRGLPVLQYYWDTAAIGGSENKISQESLSPVWIDSVLNRMVTNDRFYGLWV